MSAIAHLRGLPIVLSKQDVYPESLIAQQRIRGSSRMAALLDVSGETEWIARAANPLIVISNRFADIYRKDRGVNAGSTCMSFEIWTHAYIPEVSVEEQRQFRHERSILDDEFVLAYGGNIGVAAGCRDADRVFSPFD